MLQPRGALSHFNELDLERDGTRANTSKHLLAEPYIMRWQHQQQPAQGPDTTAEGAVPDSLTDSRGTVLTQPVPSSQQLPSPPGPWRG